MDSKILLTLSNEEVAALRVITRAKVTEFEAQRLTYTALYKSLIKVLAILERE